MKKGITLVLSVVGIILFLVFQLQAQKNVVMAVPVVKEEVYESIKESRTPVQNLTRAELQIGAVTAAWEETEQRYYIPKNMDESGFRGELGGLLDGQPVSLVWKPDSAFDNTDDAVKDRHLFSCMVYSDTEYAELTVLFTGMPVMKIDGDMGAEGTQISLFDPLFGAGGNIGRCRAALTIISVEMPANGLKKSVTSWNCWKMMERQKEKKHFSV